MGRYREPMYQRDWIRRKHDERKASGLCAPCGERPPREGKTACQQCADKQRAARGSTRPDFKAMTLAERLWAQVDRTGECWTWGGGNHAAMGL